MGCLRAEKILDYLSDPLKKSLKDDNPYVRKTAAIGVVKLFDLKPEMAIEHGFITLLQDLVTDSNPMVTRFRPLLENAFSPFVAAGRGERRTRSHGDPIPLRRSNSLRPRFHHPQPVIGRAGRMYRVGENRYSQRYCSVSEYGGGRSG